jgi:hypothetical protein
VSSIFPNRRKDSEWLSLSIGFMLSELGETCGHGVVGQCQKFLPGFAKELACEAAD